VRSVTVTGQGIVTAQPDVVIVQIGVSVDAATVAGARSRAAALAGAVVDAVKADGVADQDVKTVQFNIGPRYDNTGGVQVLRGYHVDNVLQVKIRALDTAGQVIDDAAAAGGDAAIVQGINFTIEDTSAVGHQARLLAIQDAKAKADDYAVAAGASTGQVLTISEQTSVAPQPVNASAAPVAAAASARTPVETGSLQVRVQVLVTYQLQ